MATLEEDKREAYEFAAETIKVSDSLNERVTELQELVERIWMKQAEAEARVANENFEAIAGSADTLDVSSGYYAAANCCRRADVSFVSWY